MVGIRAAKATINPEMAWILFPRSSFSKNTPKLIIPNSHRGIKMVDKELMGILYKGMLKWACLKHPIFYAIRKSPDVSIISMIISSLEIFISSFSLPLWNSLAFFTPRFEYCASVYATASE
jgi:hypothetical protein